jgi:hypothetical protein
MLVEERTVAHMIQIERRLQGPALTSLRPQIFVDTIDVALLKRL